MPVTLNPYHRICLIHEMISSGPISRIDLFESLNEKLQNLDLETISIETQDKDIRDMKKLFGAPILNKKNVGYIYTEDFSLGDMRLSEDESTTLSFILDLLKGNTHIPAIQEGVEVLSRIHRRLGGKEKSMNTISWTLSGGEEGIEFVDTLYHSIHSRTPLVLRFGQDGGNIRNREYLSPYKIITYEDVLHVSGYSHQSEKMTTIPLDRITSIEPAVGIQYRSENEQDHDIQRPVELERRTKKWNKDVLRPASKLLKVRRPIEPKQKY